MPSKAAKVVKASKSVTSQRSKSKSKSHKRTASVASFNESRDGSPAPSDTSRPSPQKRRRHSRRVSASSTAPAENPSSSVLSESQPRRGRTSEPIVVIETTPQSSIQVDRRATLSPGLLSSVKQNGNDIEVQFSPLKGTYGPDARTRRRLARNHISEEMNNIEEHFKEDRKLKQQMRELQRQLVLQEEKIAQLKFDHEAERLGAIDVAESEHAEPMRQRAESLRQRFEDLQDANPHIDINVDDVDDAEDLEDGLPDGTDNDDATEEMDYDDEEPDAYDDDNNMDTLVGSDPHQIESAKIKASQVTATTTKTVSKLSSTDTDFHIRKKLLDPMREVELKEYEDRITQLYQDAAAREARLESLVIQLKALGFSHGEPEEIEVAIRAAFRDARSTFNEIFPDDNAINLENRDFLAAVMQRLENTKTEHYEFTTRVEEARTEIQTLKRTNDGILAKYKDLEARKKALEKKWHDADVDSEAKSKSILELEDSNEALEELLEDRDVELQAKDQAMEQLRAEIEGHEHTIARHIEVEARLFEERKMLDKDFVGLEAVLAETQQNYEASQQLLESEQQKRQFVEAEADAKQTSITLLERDLERVMELRESLEAEVAKLSAQNRGTQDQLDVTSQDLNDKQSETETLKARVADANEKISELEGDIDDLRQQLLIQQTQREAAEAGLEDRDTTIDDLGNKLSGLGKEAQDLRNKLWEKQNQVEKLNEATNVREVRFQEDMATEIDRRETAEAKSAKRQAIIETLQQSIGDLTAAKDALEWEKDGIISAHIARHEKLEHTLAATEDQYATLSRESQSRIADLESQIKHLDRALLNHEANIDNLKSAAISAEIVHQTEIGQKDADIAQLNTNIDVAEDDNDALRRENLDLTNQLDDAEKRLSDLENLRTIETTNLQEEIEIQEGKIEHLMQNAVIRTEELESLVETNNSLLSKNSALKEKLKAAKAAYLDQGNEANSTIEAQEREMRNAVSRFETRKNAYQEQTSAQRSVDLQLFETDSLDMAHLATPTSTQDMHAGSLSDEEVAVVKTKKMKKSKKVKGLKSRSVYRDSGFGAADDEVDELENAEMAQI